MQIVDFNSARIFPRIINDYVSGADSLTKFYRFPHHIDSFKEAIETKIFDAAKRELLSETIFKQYKEAGIDLDIKSLVYKNIYSLKELHSYTITTGHQLCLLTGPLYFLEKIIHAIKLAQTISEQYPDKRIVPVFWMASEDHDFEEIRSLHFSGQTFSWDKQSNNSPVGKIGTTGLDTFFDRLETNVPEIHKDFFTEARAIYQTSENLSIATRKLVHRLFSSYGIVVIDADDVVLKNTFKHIISQDVLDGKPWEQLQITNNELSSLKYHQQVSGRRSNHFYIHEGKRSLIEHSNGTFSIKDTTRQFTSLQMQEEINNHPDRFSPNVVMRPVYQEFILPNLAYVGGPGEISYWLQLAGVFSILKVQFPLLICRNTFLFTDVHTRRVLKKLKLRLDEIFQGKERLQKIILHKLLPTSEEKLMQETQMMFQKLIDETTHMDNQISSELIKAKNAQVHILKKNIQRLNAVKKAMLDKELSDLDYVYSFLLPNGAPAERMWNFMSLQVSIDIFIELIYKRSAPMPEGVTVVEL